MDYAPRHHSYTPTIIDGATVPLAKDAKYQGVHLNWRTHIQKQREAVNITFRSLYWILIPQIKLSIRNGTTLYNSVLKPIWPYVAPVWGSATKSNIEILQRPQNTILRVLWYFRYDQLHQETNIEPVIDAIKTLTRNYENRPQVHPNVEALEPLTDPQCADSNGNTSLKYLYTISIFVESILRNRLLPANIKVN